MPYAPLGTTSRVLVTSKTPFLTTLVAIFHRRESSFSENFAVLGRGDCAQPVHSKRSPPVPKGHEQQRGKVLVFSSFVFVFRVSHCSYVLMLLCFFSFHRAHTNPLNLPYLV